MSDLAVGDQLDQYRITGIIARGATASIFRAEDEASGSPVTIKVPHLIYEGDPIFHANFERERRLGQRLTHPNLLRVFEPAKRSRQYLVMECVAGTPLRVLLTPGQPFDTSRTLHLMRQLTETVAHLHAEHIIHRDLKPDNVLVLAGDRLKLLDFGLALERPRRRLVWLGSTTTGTPDYMSPEQARGLAGDERSDVYALGIMVYEMLTGALPFPAGAPADDPLLVMQAKRETDPVPPRFFRPDLDPQLEEVILHAIERAPGRRYQTATELLRDLRAPQSVVVSGRAARLHPRTPRELLVRLILRWVGFAIGVVVALVLLVWLANRYPVTPTRAR